MLVMSQFKVDDIFFFISPFEELEHIYRSKLSFMLCNSSNALYLGSNTSKFIIKCLLRPY